MHYACQNESALKCRYWVKIPLSMSVNGRNSSTRDARVGQVERYWCGSFNETISSHTQTSTSGSIYSLLKFSFHLYTASYIFFKYEYIIQHYIYGRWTLQPGTTAYVVLAKEHCSVFSRNTIIRHEMVRNCVKWHEHINVK